MQSEYHVLPHQLQPPMNTQSTTSIPAHNPERSSIATSISSQLSGSTQFDNSRRPSEYGHSEPSSRKRSRADDFQSDPQESPMYNSNLSLNIPVMMGSTGHQTPNLVSPFQFRAPQLPQAASTDRSPMSDTQHLQSHQEYSSADALNPNQHHHHHLPPHSPILKRTKHGEELGSDPGPPSMVGKEGMPEPAPRPKGPKLKFTREDDALLVRLKETKNLTWKQIAEFFPGRSAGTLQVRYCTKLKAKTTLWNDDMVSDSFPCLDQRASTGTAFWAPCKIMERQRTRGFKKTASSIQFYDDHAVSTPTGARQQQLVTDSSRSRRHTIPLTTKINDHFHSHARVRLRVVSPHAHTVRGSRERKHSPGLPYLVMRCKLMESSANRCPPATNAYTQLVR